MQLKFYTTNLYGIGQKVKLNMPDSQFDGMKGEIIRRIDSVQDEIDFMGNDAASWKLSVNLFECYYIVKTERNDNIPVRNGNIMIIE